MQPHEPQLHPILCAARGDSCKAGEFWGSKSSPHYTRVTIIIPTNVFWHHFQHRDCMKGASGGELPLVSFCIYVCLGSRESQTVSRRIRQQQRATPPSPLLLLFSMVAPPLLWPPSMGISIATAINKSDISCAAVVFHDSASFGGVIFNDNIPVAIAPMETSPLPSGMAVPLLCN